MEALMRVMLQTQHDPMTTSMFDAEVVSDGGRKVATGGVGSSVVVVVVAARSGATCGVFAAAGACWRPAAASLTSGHTDVVGRAAGGVAFGSVVATGACSQRVVAQMK
jgi:hypothetical protein